MEFFIPRFSRFSSQTLMQSMISLLRTSLLRCCQGGEKMGERKKNCTRTDPRVVKNLTEVKFALIPFPSFFFSILTITYFCNVLQRGFTVLKNLTIANLGLLSSHLFPLNSILVIRNFDCGKKLYSVCSNPLLQGFAVLKVCYNGIPIKADVPSLKITLLLIFH